MTNYPTLPNRTNKPLHCDLGTNQSIRERESEKEDKEWKGESKKENKSDESESGSKSKERERIKNIKKIITSCYNALSFLRANYSKMSNFLAYGIFDEVGFCGFSC